MEKDFPDMMIEDLNIPYVAMATDVANNKEVKFTSGSVYKAIRASIALPALIKSVQNSDQVLVDGGVLNPIPIRQIQRTPDDIVVVVNLYDFDQEPEADAIILHNSDEVISHPTVSIENNTDKSKLLNRGQKLLSTVQKKASVSNNYASILSKVTTMMLQVNAFSAIELHKPDIVINIPRSSAGTFDFHKSEELIKIGQLATQKAIQEFRNKH
jgi:NTE family protein